MYRVISGQFFALFVVFVIVGFGLSPAQADTPPPPGANDFNCRPGSFLHPKPRPVVLVHGTFENMFNNWGFLSPALAASGYCVFALNYGENQFSGGLIFGLNHIEQSAVELANFIDTVLTATGAPQVDIVGHSQGGMMPRYYLKFLGGASKVHHLIGLGPSNHGTDLHGLLTLAEFFPQFEEQADQIRAGGEAVTENICPACVDQLKDSAFLNNLNAGGDTVPDVKFTVIATRFDEVVTPHTSQFLDGANVNNITVQQVCPFDTVEHIFLPYDPVVINLVMEALDPPSFEPPFGFCGFGGGNSDSGGSWDGWGN